MVSTLWRYRDRMDYAVRTAPREQLVAELRQAAADRTTHGKLERAAEATRAADALERIGGGDCAHFERVLYQVADERDRASVIRKPLDELIDELDEAGAGWAHDGKVELAKEAARALAGLESGATQVRVGHLVYEVAADTQVVHPQPLRDAPSGPTVTSGS